MRPHPPAPSPIPWRGGARRRRRPLSVSDSPLRSPLSTQLERGLGGEASSRARLTVDPRTKRALLLQARTFRKAPTPAEHLLWQRLRNAQLAGLRVRRQQPIGPFIVDFFVAAAKLVIEIDGDVHDGMESQARDVERQRLLEATGLRVLRFRNEEVLEDMQAVVARIEKSLTPLPPLQLRGEGEQDKIRTPSPDRGRGGRG